MQRAGILAWALVSAGLVVVGALGPWLTALGVVSVNGWTLEKKAAGILIVLALLGALSVWVRRDTAQSGAFAACTGLPAALLALYEHHHISTRISSSVPGYGRVLNGLVHVGWGLDLALIASASLMLAGFASFFFEAEPRAEAATASASQTYEPTVPAGWYPDPNDSALLRYWNGFGWTTQTATPAS